MKMASGLTQGSSPAVDKPCDPGLVTSITLSLSFCICKMGVK